MNGSYYAARGLWPARVSDSRSARLSLAGDLRCDVAIVGAGFTGLWSAYWLSQTDPSLRIVVLDRNVVGSGASGRNGGWVSPGIAGDAGVYARERGAVAVRLAERLTNDAIDEIGAIVAREDIACGWHKPGQIVIATNAAQMGRLTRFVARKREFGAEEDDWRILTKQELEARVRVRGAEAGAFSRHCAHADPARFVEGLARAAERRGVDIRERTQVLSIEPGRVTTAEGRVFADWLLQTTGVYSVDLPGQRRRYLPLHSYLIATEPLAPDVWSEIGWSGRESIHDLRHLFFHAQRTEDDRLVIGGRGAPAPFRSRISDRHDANEKVEQLLIGTLQRHFPAAHGARIEYSWGGPLDVARDWCQALNLDVHTGIGDVGGYAGHGIVGAYLNGRAMADLLLGRETALTTLPWIGRTSPRWEPEPLRFLASHGIVRLLASADAVEDRTGSETLRVRLASRFLGGQ